MYEAKVDKAKYLPRVFFTTFVLLALFTGFIFNDSKLYNGDHLIEEIVFFFGVPAYMAGFFTVLFLISFTGMDVTIYPEGVEYDSSPFSTNKIYWEEIDNIYSRLGCYLLRKQNPPGYLSRSSVATTYSGAKFARFRKPQPLPTRKVSSPI